MSEMTEELLIRTSRVEEYLQKKSEAEDDLDGTVRIKRKDGTGGRAFLPAVDQRLRWMIENVKERANFEARQTVLERDIPVNYRAGLMRSKAPELVFKSRVREELKPYRLSEDGLQALAEYVENILGASVTAVKKSGRKTLIGEDVVL